MVKQTGGSAEVSLNDVRQKAQNTLDKGVSNGSLGKMMAEGQSALMVKQTGGSAEVSLNDVRQKAKNTLDKGLSDGSVVKEMSKEAAAPNSSVQEVRTKARAGFENAMLNGSLKVALDEADVRYRS